jgi:hypothetical protein
MNKLQKTNKKIADTLVGTNKKIEKAVVGTHQAISDNVVGGYHYIEDKFIDTFLKADTETTDEAHQRLRAENDARQVKQAAHQAKIQQAKMHNQEGHNHE